MAPCSNIFTKVSQSSLSMITVVGEITHEVPRDMCYFMVRANDVNKVTIPNAFQGAKNSPQRHPFPCGDMAPM